MNCALKRRLNIASRDFFAQMYSFALNEKFYEHYLFFNCFKTLFKRLLGDSIFKQIFGFNCKIGPTQKFTVLFDIGCVCDLVLQSSINSFNQSMIKLAVFFVRKSCLLSLIFLGSSQCASVFLNKIK